MMGGGYKEPPKFLLREVNATAEAGYDYTGYTIGCTSDGSKVYVVSTGNDEGGTNAGAVYEFENNNGVFTQLHKFTGSLNADGTQTGLVIASQPNYGPTFGGTVNNAGNELFLGEGNWKDANGDAIGRVRVFSSSSSGWEVAQTIISPETEKADDRFGACVKLNDAGTILAISAVKEEGSTTQPDSLGYTPGAVYLYHSSSSGWELAQTIDFPGNSSQFGHSFGASINIVGNKMAIGGPWAHPDTDTVFMYESGSSGWEFKEKVAEGLWGYANFGENVMISNDGNLLAVSGAGYKKLLIYTSGSSGWEFAQQLNGDYTGFGKTLAIHANVTGDSTGYTLITTAPYADGLAGLTYVYESKQANGVWEDFTLYQTLEASEKRNYYTGQSITITPDKKWFFLGAPNQASPGAWNGGKVYAYEWSDEY